MLSTLTLRIFLICISLLLSPTIWAGMSYSLSRSLNDLYIQPELNYTFDGGSTYQVDASWPLKRTPLNMNGYLYAQYYKGYGETLLHYNRNAQSQVRFGIAITP